MPKLKNDIFYKADAESIAISSQYVEVGYKDLHIILSQLKLANGISYDKLFVKLVDSSGAVGIEFRDSVNGNLFRHFEDSTDQYGPYLRYLDINDGNNLGEQLIQTNRMNASERVLVFSCIMLLPELLSEPLLQGDFELNDKELAHWRLCATRLKLHVEGLPSWLSFDAVYLKENYKSDSYEHIWLVFKNFLVGALWRDEFDVKIAATGINNENVEIFCQSIHMEFRENRQHGGAPFFSWPPITSDEHGPKLEIPISELNQISLNNHQDNELIRHLGSNLPSIIDKVDDDSVPLRRSKRDWKRACEFLITDTTKKSSHELVQIKDVHSEGGDQHITFLIDEEKILLKITAVNIQPETFEADITIELQNGTSDIIYKNTEFFVDDEIEPKISIPFDLYLKDIQIQREQEFCWLNEALEKVYQFLNEASTLDDLIRRLWVNILKVAKTNCY